MFEISPAILESEWSEIEKKIEIVKPFAKTIHIDIIDGKFIDKTTFLDPEPFKKYTENIFFELHMMVDNPELYLNSWSKAGFKRFLGHVEKMPDQVAFVARAQEVGEAGLALDGPTPITEITVSLLDLDTVFVYTAQKVGASGGVLLPERLEKVRELAVKSTLPISVDGGINEQTIADAFNAGARHFGVTNGIFKQQDPSLAFTKLHDTCSSLLSRV